ncbi:hypothetical protein GLYMA_01G047400v4 [Glycine max]|uniref:PTC1-like winged helix-turn-helix domain-containing protein n=1 Tax=Glycine max TaxID=3847 RepID=A0A0R0L6J6_SOYBN|nr:hypothetical protein GLYMA_01G047400v4 [Glycine max]
MEMPMWSFQHEVHHHPPLHILLFVIEEPIEAALNRHCKHCQYVGWGNHFICNKYHFVLPSKEALGTCTSCDAITTTNNGKSKLIELQGHMMHGVFHSNGFGHLLCVNGLEMGSSLAGNQIMEFWNRLCYGLQARKRLNSFYTYLLKNLFMKVSLNDISHKRGMKLRLMNGIAYNETWFGSWGYKFGRGCFGVTQSMYHKAIQAIRSMSLYLIIHHIANSSHGIPLIFSRNQTLSDQSLVTLGDLFCYMLDLKSCLPLETNCRWSPKRIEMATRVIVEALKRTEFKWVSRQEVRDAARAYISDTSLVDFVLRSLGNHVEGNYLDKLKPIMRSEFLSAIPLAARIILGTKYFIKDYFGDIPHQVELGSDDKLNIYCTIWLRNNVGSELRSFMVESFGNLSVNNETMAFGLIEVGGKQICESDMNNGIMDCTCGTIEDDGERMVSCDICEIWQHTRCV